MQGRSAIPQLTPQSFEQAFEIEYTHNSTAIEGNTLTLMETKLVLEDGISVGGKSLREIYESVNHQKAYHYVKECIDKGLVLEWKDQELDLIELAAWTHGEFVKIHPFPDATVEPQG